MAATVSRSCLGEGPTLSSVSDMTEAHPDGMSRTIFSRPALAVRRVDVRVQVSARPNPNGVTGTRARAHFTSAVPRCNRRQVVNAQPYAGGPPHGDWRREE